MIMPYGVSCLKETRQPQPHFQRSCDILLKSFFCHSINQHDTVYILAHTGFVGGSRAKMTMIKKMCSICHSIQRIYFKDNIGRCLGWNVFEASTCKFLIVCKVGKQISYMKKENAEMWISIKNIYTSLHFFGCAKQKNETFKYIFC